MPQSMPARGQVEYWLCSMEENETAQARLRTLASESADATGSPYQIVLPEGTTLTAHLLPQTRRL